MMIAINEWGEKHLLKGKAPRKELLAALGHTKADKMYQDKADGSTVHTGYVICGVWWDLYTLVPMERKA